MQKMFGKVLLSVALLAFSVLAVIVPARASTDPALVLLPDEGSLGTSVTAYGYGFPASDDTIYNVTIWWESIDYCEGQDEPLTWVLTGVDGRFEAHFEAPHTYGGPHNVTAITDGAEPTSATAVFTVTPSLSVDPATGYNEGTVMNVYGTGLDPSDGPYLWYIDNMLFAGKDEGFHPDCRGNIHFQFVCAGFCCSGSHSVFAVKGGTQQIQTTGYTYEIEAYATFTVVREEAAILDEIMKTDIRTIKEGIVGIEGEMATITTNMETLDGRIVEVDGDIATVKTDIGTIKVDVSDLKTDIGTIREGIVGIATIKTDVETLDGRIATIEGDITAIKTDLGSVKDIVAAGKTNSLAAASAASDAKAAAEAARLEASGVWFLSLVAAIASAATLIITVFIIFLE